jgi:hypothetical protein
MSIIDSALRANLEYAKRYDPKRGQPPTPKIAGPAFLARSGKLHSKLPPERMTEAETPK